jgi:2-amino-4-hydroxy-6-hydroxymethyldihydropteridine diphosphokinase
MTPSSRRAYLGIGTNLGDRLAFLQGAVDGLAATTGITVIGVSRVYETDPVGGPEQPDFLNAVVAIDTALGAHELLVECQRLEQEAHRVRGARWGPRTLDVDLILYGDEQIDTADLAVPHPRAGERAFVLVPLADLAPDRADALDPARAVRSGPDQAQVRSTGLQLSLPE